MKEYPLVSVVIPTHNRKYKLIRLIESILQSNYPEDKLEIIVVDDASTDGTYGEVKRRFPKVKIIRNEKELYLAGSRNVGIRNAKGEYIFLIDDDNVVDKNCILELVEIMEKNPKIGIIAPIMYYLSQPNRVWCAGIRRNMITSLTTYIGLNEVDNGQFNGLIESNDFPNAFMVRREVFKRVGLLDQKNFLIHYDEGDFGERVRRAGYKVVFNPKAKIWHDVPLDVKDRSMLSRTRAYYAGRNRVVFHKKYSKRWQYLIFILIFNWVFTFYYLKIILLESRKPFEERLRIAKAYLKGVMDGLRWPS